MAAPKLDRTPPPPLPPGLRALSDNKLILRGREWVSDEWRYIDEDPTGSSLALIFPLARWQAERDQWWSWAGRLGVRIGPADKIGVLASDLKRLALVAVEFPNAGDGRGYSHARLLRERYRFTGEIRAVGYVKRDQLFFQARCGFDAFELSAGEKPDEVLNAFKDFDTAYQTLPDHSLHLKRRDTLARVK